ncbi:MAG: hypothetical protein K1X75_10960 [Leptospirales bacterium]|nr:hypothetical protein [Leptospirales bacterium]
MADRKDEGQDIQHGDSDRKTLVGEDLRTYRIELRHGRAALRAQPVEIGPQALDLAILERDPPLVPGSRVDGLIWGPGLHGAYPFIGAVRKIENAETEMEFTLISIALDNGAHFPYQLIASAIEQ